MADVIEIAEVVFRSEKGVVVRSTAKTYYFKLKGAKEFTGPYPTGVEAREAFDFALDVDL